MADPGLGVDVALLFLHIPKTGGSTLSAYLYGHPAFRTPAAGIAPSIGPYYDYGIYHYPGGFLNDTHATFEPMLLTRASTC